MSFTFISTEPIGKWRPCLPLDHPEQPSIKFFEGEICPRGSTKVIHSLLLADFKNPQQDALKLRHFFQRALNDRDEFPILIGYNLSDSLNLILRFLKDMEDSAALLSNFIPVNLKNTYPQGLRFSYQKYVNRLVPNSATKMLRGLFFLIEGKVSNEK